MDKNQIKEYIAKRAARELNDGDVVNLGIGLPTLVANYIEPDLDITFQSENGFIGLGAYNPENHDQYIANAGGDYVSIKPYGAFFDSAESFCIIRGGHVDVTILGALQVDQDGNLANWIIPGKLTPGMGGAMDLVCGAKKVIVAMEHTAKGAPKILKKCTLPLTALGEVDLIITEMCVLKVTDKGLLLTEVNPEFTVDDIKAATEADIIIAGEFS